MKTKSTKKLSCLAAFICLLLLTFAGSAQTSRTLESGGFLSTLTKDDQGNLYAAKYNGTTDRYDIVKYNNGTTPPVTIFTGLQYTGVDYPWGIAVDSQGNVFVAGSATDNEVYKLSFDSGTNTYSSSVVMSGNYCTALAFDASDNLYTAEYNSGSGKYQIVRYAAGTYTNGTVLYNNINLKEGYTYPTSIAVASNNDIYFNLAFGVPKDPDHGGVLKLTAASNYSSVSTISSGKYSTAIAIDQLGNLYVSEYNAAVDKFVLNKYINATGTPTQLAIMDSYSSFFAWGIAVFNSDNIYYITGSTSTSDGGALIQLYASPITQSSNIIASAQSANSTTLTWTKGSGDKRVVFVTQSNSGTPSVSNNTTYTANANYGSGSKDGSGNWYCVYNGNGNTVALSNLQPDITYRVMVLDYNGNSGLEMYQTASATGNPVNIGVATISAITRADADNTYATVVNYNVDFNTDVTGLTAANFTLTAGPYITGATVTSVTAVSGSQYKVTVQKSAGSGDLTLNLANTNNLTPIVVSTLPFVGETYHLKTTEVDLAALQLSDGALDPTFSADILTYSVAVQQPTIVITPTAVNTTSAITVGTQTVPSGNSSTPITLTEGVNVITVKVSSASSALSKSYVLNVTYTKPLPVTWVDFDASYNNGLYIWAWKLGVESQIDHYEPEYSLDGIKYYDAGKVTEKQASLKYQFSTSLNLDGLIYFRVKAVNMDGTSSYSNVKTLQAKTGVGSLLIYPNPVETKMHMRWPNKEATSLDIAIYNTLGKKVLHLQVAIQPVVTLQVGQLTTGSYYLVVKDNRHNGLWFRHFLKK